MLLPVRVGAFGAVHHHEVRLEVSQFFIARADEHVFHEVRLPGHLGDEAHFQARVGVGAAEGIHHEQAFAGQLFGDQVFQIGPHFRAEGFVVVFAFALIGPPHGIAGDVVADDVFVFRRAAGEDAGIDGDGTQLGDYPTLKTFQRWVCFFLKQQFIARVVNDFANVVNAVSGQILRGYTFNAHVTTPWSQNFWRQL